MRKLLASLVPVVALLAVAPLTSAPVPKKLPKSGTIFTWTNGTPPVLNLYTPDGEHLKRVKLGTKQDCTILNLSPGGHYITVTTKAEKANPVTGIIETRVHLLPLVNAADELPEPITVGSVWNVCWSADGRRLFITTGTGEQVIDQGAARLLTSVVEYDTATGVVSPLDLGDGHLLWEVSADGQTFLTSTYIYRGGTPKRNHYHLVRTNPSATVPLFEPEGVAALGLHPDGKRVFLQQITYRQIGAGGTQFDCEHLVLDPDTGRTSPLDWSAKVKAALANREPADWAFSPDRKRVVLRWTEEVKLPIGWVDLARKNTPLLADRFGTCDLDGGNFKIIHSPKPKSAEECQTSSIDGFAWR